MNWSDRSLRGQDFTRIAGKHAEGTKNTGGSWFNIGSPGQKETNRNPVHVRIDEAGIKAKSPGHYLKPGSGADWFDGGPAAHGSGSKARKAASAAIAKIPFALASHIARCWAPK